MHDALIISDLHLGQEVCCAEELVEFLELLDTCKLATRRLILNGDVFDSHDFRRLKKTHWKVLSLLRKLSDDMQIIWVAGNHDGPAEVISHLLGVNVVDEYVFSSNKERILVQHGHVYDEFVNNYPLTVWFADTFYNLFQKFNKSGKVCRWIKKRSKTYLRVAAKMEELAVRHAINRNKTIICCGHSHLAEVKHYEGITYYNSGCWTERPCTYISIQNGDIKLEEFSATVST